MRGRRLTLKEKKHIGSLKLNPKNWLMQKKSEKEWQILNKQSGKSRVVKGQ